MPKFVDCSESVEEALARLDMESKAKKQAKLNATKKVEDAPFSSSSNAETQPQRNSLVDALKEEDMNKCRKLYPERGGDPYKPSWFKIMWMGEGREGIDKIKCERNVWEVVKKSHLVRILLDALKASGCEVDLRRHISCEVCHASVTGGYDPFLNQVVVCQNTARYKGFIQGVLTHELIHMFDFCRNKMDLKDPRHLACTEIRAANLAHCSFLSAWAYGSVSPLNIKAQHQECVKQRATDSVVAVRDIPKEEARAIVDEVFDKCYGDLEPIGRRILGGEEDIEKAYEERVIFGYV